MPKDSPLVHRKNTLEGVLKPKNQAGKLHL